MDDKRTTVTDADVRMALGAVIDPDHGKDIVTLGRVTGLVVRDGNVGFAIEVEAARGPRLEPLRKAAEDAVMRLPGVVSVTAVLTAERAAGTAAPRPAPAPPDGVAPADRETRGVGIAIAVPLTRRAPRL